MVLRLMERFPAMIPDEATFWCEFSEERQVELLHYEMIRETQEAELAFGPIARKSIG